MLQESTKWTWVLKELISTCLQEKWVSVGGLFPSLDTDITSLNNWNFKPGNFIPEIHSSALSVSVINHQEKIARTMIFSCHKTLVQESACP